MKLLFAAMLLFSTSAFAARDCMNQREIRNFHAPSSTSLIVDTYQGRYELQLSFCSELPWAHRIAFDSFSFNRVCSGDRVLVLDNISNRVIQSCHIFDIRRTL